MPAKFKTEITNRTPLERAARKRVLDEGFNDLTEEQIQLRIAQYLTLQTRRKSPGMTSGEVMLSHSFRDFLRDSKFFVHMNNGHLSALDKEIRNSASQGFGVLADIQKEAEALNSLISEEEIKLLGNYDQVHFNAFVRQTDMGLNFTNKRWLVDYKTSHAFLVDNISDILPGAGVTLPVRETVRVPIIGATLIGEETDVGDSRKPIVQNDVRNVFLPDKVWRYVIIRHEHIKNSRKFNFSASTVAIQLKLPNLQLVNFLNLEPISQRGLKIDELGYVNEAGETVELDTFQVNVETNQILLFEPVRTRYLKIRLKAMAPMTKTEYNAIDWSTKEINDILRGSGWSHLLPEKDDIVQGRVFDFSLKSISTGLRIYEPLGVYRSRPTKVKSPLGVSISERSASISVSSAQRSYGVDFALPDGVVLNEYYLGVRLRRPGGRVAMNDLVPIPDSYPIQREFMPLVGSETKAKLFPDMLWNIEKVSVTEIEHGTDVVNPSVKVTTSEPHGFADGDQVTVLGGTDYSLNGDYEIFAVTGDSFEFRVSALNSDQLVDGNTLPKVYAYKETDQSDPIVFNLENDTLTVGTDYEISLDGGSTWQATFPRGADYITALTDPQAGNFKIKLVNPQYDRLYWIEYRPLKNQKLSKDGLVTLKNGRVVFSPTLADTKGSISTVIVSRADNSNPQVTPVVLFYALKVRERVS